MNTKVFKRSDGRKLDEVRKIKITRNYLKYPSGSVLIEVGDTKVICTAFVEENVPNHRKGSGGGWITAEYGMLPMSTQNRYSRETFGRNRGRTQEIQRLIGRSLRAVVDLDELGERTIYIDADVIQADGGTRTASINGAFIALADAVKHLLKERIISKSPIKEYIAAVSVGVIEGVSILDLSYIEDSAAEVDMNIVMTESGRFIEIQGTAESDPFSKEDLEKLLNLAKKGIQLIIKKGKEVLGK